MEELKGTVKELIPRMLELDDSKEYTVKEYKEKRSLNANNYYWALVSKIAEALTQTKEFVHLAMLKQYSDVTPILLEADKDISGLIKYYEVDGRIKRNGKEFISYKVYRPSSEMNTKQMATLIDGVVYEAQEMGIPTMTPNEIEELKINWGQI